ncbi:MAG: ABC transporter [Desulfuromonadales bacterium C00003093]|nr:MAG: ABC transporter [Desulfuromonadales bacterium C00003093]
MNVRAQNSTATQSNSPLIEVSELSKKFAEVTAVDQINFTIRQGELFGLLGPNGAGKTTMINIFIGLARPDSGKVSINGLDLSINHKAAQHLIGIVPDKSNLYPELSGFDNLCFCASLYGIPNSEASSRAEELLDQFNLTEAAHRKFGAYSSGMKRKLTIAAGIIHHPEILFLDEPTTGIDVTSARQVRKLIADLHRSGMTILLTTHYIEEAERLCQRIAFIVKGKIVRIDSIENLLQPIQDIKSIEISFMKGDDHLSDKLSAAFPEYVFHPISPNQVRIESTEDLILGPLVYYIENQGSQIVEARRITLSLEDVFVQVTGLELDKMKNNKEEGKDKK